MRKNWRVLLIAAGLGLSSQALAQDATQAGAPKMASAEVAVGTGIAERQLTGMAESFPASAGTLYCYMKIADAAGSEIEHVWYKGDTEMARVKLNVAGTPWRTWSSKKIGADAAGDWRCDVVQNGTVIKTARFKVE